MRDGLITCGLGVGIGLAAGLGLAHLMSSLLYGVAPRGAMTFSSVAALLLAVTIGECTIPARPAMQVDPLVALRHE